MTRSAGAEPFPWEAVLHVGLGLLRLDPAAVWRLTPLEFAALTGRLRPHGAAPTRADLAALLRRYPDGE
ncbi:MAG: rcc01693 family protein [Pararhizobium sp.]